MSPLGMRDLLGSGIKPRPGIQGIDQQILSRRATRKGPQRGPLPSECILLPLLLSHVSRVRLYDPIDSIPPGSPIPGILQARTLQWVAISFSVRVYMGVISLPCCSFLCELIKLISIRKVMSLKLVSESNYPNPGGHRWFSELNQSTAQ